MRVAISRGDEMLVQRAWGTADVAANRPATPATVYEIGSVSAWGVGNRARAHARARAAGDVAAVILRGVQALGDAARPSLRSRTGAAVRARARRPHRRAMSAPSPAVRWRHASDGPFTGDQHAGRMLATECLDGPGTVCDRESFVEVVRRGRVSRGGLRLATVREV